METNHTSSDLLNTRACETQHTNSEILKVEHIISGINSQGNFMPIVDDCSFQI